MRNRIIIVLVIILSFIVFNKDNNDDQLLSDNKSDSIPNTEPFITSNPLQLMNTLIDNSPFHPAMPLQYIAPPMPNMMNNDIDTSILIQKEIHDEIICDPIIVVGLPIDFLNTLPQIMQNNQGITIDSSTGNVMFSSSSTTGGGGSLPPVFTVPSNNYTSPN